MYQYEQAENEIKKIIPLTVALKNKIPWNKFNVHTLKKRQPLFSRKLRTFSRRLKLNPYLSPFAKLF
jgi:hypothetical protein